MNVYNLKRAYAHIRDNVPAEMLNMETYRSGQREKPICDSVGCVIGHCVELDDWENIPHSKREGFGIAFIDWSNKFFGISYTEKLWVFLFGSGWTRTVGGTKEQILLRIKYGIDNGTYHPDFVTADYTLVLKED